MSYFFHPNAEREHLESVAFYETRQAGLGSSYLSDFEGVMAVVCAHPHRYPIEEQPDIRRVRLKRFPYNILLAFRSSRHFIVSDLWRRYVSVRPEKHGC
jgi:hypothetical protein